MKTFSKKIIAGLFAGVAFSSVADTTITPTVGFTTLPDITLSEIDAINFGTVLKLSANATCTFLMDGTTHGVAAATIRAATADMTNAAGIGLPGTLTGDCATGVTFDAPTIASKGIQYGLYEIVAEAGTDVTVVLTGINSTELAFEPSGYGIAAGGSEVVLDDSLGGNAITTPSAATATSTAGVVRIALGGTITNNVKLDPDQSYTAGLQIDVNY